jgi:hypothetical protein
MNLPFRGLKFLAALSGSSSRENSRNRGQVAVHNGRWVSFIADGGGSQARSQKPARQARSQKPEATKDRPEARSQKPEEKAKAEDESQKLEEKAKAKAAIRFAHGHLAALRGWTRCGAVAIPSGVVVDFSSGFWLSTSAFAFSSAFWLLASALSSLHPSARPALRGRPFDPRLDAGNGAAGDFLAENLFNLTDGHQVLPADDRGDDSQPVDAGGPASRWM